MTLPTKDYYRIDEVAGDWHCRTEDIFHHFLHGRIRLGVALHHTILHGLNAERQTIGIYFVTGVVTIPTYGVEPWELGHDEPMDAGGFLIERDYPPRIAEASFMDEAEFPSLMPWAPGRDWDTPETDVSLIEGFVVSDERLLTIQRSDVVIHAVERARFDAERGSVAPNRSSQEVRAYVSNELETLQKASHRFWANADPDDRGTQPENKDVIAWLIDKGYSASRAAKAAAIIRPDWAPVGRKPDE